MTDREYQRFLSFQLSKVVKLEVYAKELSKFMFERQVIPELQMQLRDDYVGHIMKYKPYNATEDQFKNWSADALREEIDRITKMRNDPLVKPTPPNWKKVKTVDSDEALKFKRMRAELVAAGYGLARSIAKWSKLKIVETYKKLEELRAEDSNVLQNSVYPTTAALSLKIHTPKNLLSSSALSESEGVWSQISRQHDRE
ncbi:hypothetical protein HanIR_Chr15g0753621 [Helianthus annuus]|nr:hypothetical protein HanIR_Chr15g0753621 [Helianthus annuus]